MLDDGHYRPQDSSHYGAQPIALADKVRNRWRIPVVDANEFPPGCALYEVIVAESA